MKLGQGGRKAKWDERLRARALRRAREVGAEAAGDELGIPSGTVRSWVRREKLRRERDAVDMSGLEAVKAAGRAIVETRLSRSPAEREAVLAERRVRLARLVERGLADWSAAESWGLSSASEERAAAMAAREPEGDGRE